MDCSGVLRSLSGTCAASPQSRNWATYGFHCWMQVASVSGGSRTVQREVERNFWFGPTFVRTMIKRAGLRTSSLAWSRARDSLLMRGSAYVNLPEVSGQVVQLQFAACLWMLRFLYCVFTQQVLPHCTCHKAVTEVAGMTNPQFLRFCTHVVLSLMHLSVQPISGGAWVLTLPPAH